MHRHRVEEGGGSGERHEVVGMVLDTSRTPSFTPIRHLLHKLIFCVLLMMVGSFDAWEILFCDVEIQGSTKYTM